MIHDDTELPTEPLVKYLYLFDTLHCNGVFSYKISLCGVQNCVNHECSSLSVVPRLIFDSKFNDVTWTPTSRFKAHRGNHFTTEVSM
jgi:hypothetical protein